jgi:hypothetical protein
VTPTERMTRIERAIIRIEAKWKLGRNRPAADIDGVPKTANG